MNNGEKIQPGIGEKQAAERYKEIGEHAIDLLDEEACRAELDRQYDDSEMLRRAFHNIDGTDNFMGIGGSPFAEFGEEGFSGDGASLFMLVQFQKEEGTKTELVKVGWGEFSKLTFTKGAKTKYSEPYVDFRDGKTLECRLAAEHEILRSLPFDVYCVGQRESFLADDEEIKNDMLFNPEKYLREHAKFVAKDGEVTLATQINPMDKELEYDIVPISEEEAMRSIGQMKELYRETIDKLSKTDEG